MWRTISKTTTAQKASACHFEGRMRACASICVRMCVRMCVRAVPLWWASVRRLRVGIKTAGFRTFGMRACASHKQGRRTGGVRRAADTNAMHGVAHAQHATGSGQRTAQNATLTTHHSTQRQPAQAGETADGTEQYFRVLGYLTACNVQCCERCHVLMQPKTRSLQHINRTARRRRAQ